MFGRPDLAYGYFKVSFFFFSRSFIEFFFIFRRILFISETSFLGVYDTDWKINYVELHKPPFITSDKQAIQILVKVMKKDFFVKT